MARVGQSTRPVAAGSSVRALARPGRWFVAQRRPRRECVESAACWHRCIGGIDQLGTGEQCVVPGSVSVPVRSAFEPTLILASGATSAELLRWAAVLDLYGYYLATAVLAYVLCRQ